MSGKFYPTKEPQNLSATAAASRVQLTEKIPQSDIVLRVVNSGDKPVYLKFGGPEVAASSTNGMIVLSKALPEYINWPENWTHLSYVCGAGDTTSVQVVLGRMGK